MERKDKGVKWMKIMEYPSIIVPAAVPPILSFIKAMYSKYYAYDRSKKDGRGGGGRGRREKELVYHINLKLGLHRFFFFYYYYYYYYGFCYNYC